MENKGGRCIHGRCVQERVHTGSSVQHLLNQPKAARLLRSGSRYPMTSKALLPLQSVERCQNHHIPFPVLITENLSPKPSSNTCQESHNSQSLTLLERYREGNETKGLKKFNVPFKRTQKGDGWQEYCGSERKKERARVKGSIQNRRPLNCLQG